MRNVPQDIQSCRTLCKVWIISLKDMSRLGFSDHDQTLSFEGVNCEPQSGFSGAKASSELGFDVDGGDIEGVLNGSFISAADVRNGRFEDARVDHYRVNWKNPDQFVHMSMGRIGAIQQKGAIFEAEWLGDADQLERSTGRVFSRMCDAEFGDARCGLDLADYPEGTTCPRTFTACHEQFGNSLNFRGFPYLLGDDALVAAPLEGEVRDGGSRYS